MSLFLLAFLRVSRYGIKPRTYQTKIEYSSVPTGDRRPAHTLSKQRWRPGVRNKPKPAPMSISTQVPLFVLFFCSSVRLILCFNRLSTRGCRMAEKGGGSTLNATALSRRPKANPWRQIKLVHTRHAVRYYCTRETGWKRRRTHTNWSKRSTKDPCLLTTPTPPKSPCSI